jgi:hypothetical protein
MNNKLWREKWKQRKKKIQGILERFGVRHLHLATVRCKLPQELHIIVEINNEQ